MVDKAFHAKKMHSLTHPEKVQVAVGSDDFEVFSSSGLEQPCAVSQCIYHSRPPFTSLHDLATDLFTYELYNNYTWTYKGWMLCARYVFL